MPGISVVYNTVGISGRWNMKKTKGFSLIELMTVIAIIAILSAIALPIYSKSKCKAQWGEVPNCLSDIALRMENYRSNHGFYPKGADGAIPDVLNVDSAKCGSYYEIRVWTDAAGTHYYIDATDAEKLPCSANDRDDQWVLTDTSPKILHVKNSVSPTQVDADPGHP